MNQILIVDDEQNFRTTLAEILRGEGSEVSTAATGEEAVRLVEEGNFDVILLDLRMPGFDGVETLRRIRRIDSSVRVIMMSAHSVDEVKQVAFDQGVVAFISKPLEIERVIELTT